MVVLLPARVNSLYQPHGGLVRAGLQALWMPALDYYPGITAQTVTDRSGNGNTLTLGSTSGVDANDPSWTNQGLVFNPAGPDYCVLNGSSQLPSGNSDNTLIVVASHVDAATSNQVLLSVGPLSPTTAQVTAIGVPNDAIAFYGQQDDFISVIPFVSTDGFAMLSTVYTGATRAVTVRKDLTSAQSATVTSNLGIPRPTNVTLGNWVNRGSYGFGGTVAAVMIYDRALSPAEIARNERWLKAQLTPSGITLP